MITIRVDTTPRGKGRPRFTRAGFAYTDPKTRSYEALLRDTAMWTMGAKAPLEGPLHVHVTAFMPIPKSMSEGKKVEARAGHFLPTTKPDADNILKTLDAFNGIVWKDDAQIVEATVVKRYSSSPALVVVARAA